MTAEEKKEYLRGFQRLNREIEQKQFSLQKLIDSRDKITSIISLAPGSNGDNDRMRICDDIIDMENELKIKINEAMRIRSEIQDKIDSLENSDQRTVLNYRYIENLRFEMIATFMNYSTRTVLRYHKSGLNNIKI